MIKELFHMMNYDDDDFSEDDPADTEYSTDSDIHTGVESIREQGIQPRCDEHTDLAKLTWLRYRFRFIYLFFLILIILILDVTFR